MDDFEIWVDGEHFRVSDRIQPHSGRTSYDFAWLNGPAEGTYGFTTMPYTVGPDGHAVGRDLASGSTEDLRSELTESAREFVEGFYAPGGIGEEDFPDHPPANRD